jgi:mannose-6-phosphate isomerase class I
LSQPDNNNTWRKTEQYLLPERKDITPLGKYDIYPALKIADNQIFTGFAALGKIICQYKRVLIDGYAGIFFEHFIHSLETAIKQEGFSVSSVSTSVFLRPEPEINRLTEPFLGGDDPVFGTRCSLDLSDFFYPDLIHAITPDEDTDISILFGQGAFLCGWDALKIYIDLPKNEVQFRSRAGSINNLGASKPLDPKEMYKRFYFVDWVVLNKHKKDFLPSVNIYVDEQHPELPAWMYAETLRKALHLMATNVFRVRPWFEPGPWGGTWIKEHIGGLNQEVPNYAWSFELITPENGLLLDSSSLLLEVSFDCLMYLEAESVLGDCYKRFGTAFPIRFDFLDTYNGGNLSLQCHPRPEYIKEHFGEDFTQEECYYILDNKENSAVFLGFRDDINPEKFREDLEKSFSGTTVLDPGKYILRHESHKHDLFLIPYGTIHGSGKNNLVLEISSTPYIFTFKMYDWLRPDLDGKPRPLNIRRGMENLYFDRKGDYIKQKLISKPELIETGPGWMLYHLPTHETHMYEVYRYHFNKKIKISTNNKCLVSSLVEGSSIEIETRNGLKQTYCYAETFVIPAAAEYVNISNNSANEAILITAFIK